MVNMRNEDSKDWKAFLDGDKMAITNIYQRHKDNLLTYGFYLTGNKEKCEDLLHETFMKLIEQGKKKIQINSLKNWLFICMRNLTFNHLQRQRKDPRINLNQLTVENTDPDITIFIRQILNKLDTEERELILLREQQGFSINELADMHKISPEAVRIRLYRIRKKMYELGKV